MARDVSTTRPRNGTSGTLALDGATVRQLLGGVGGAEIGAALRWLERQVADNPELNTSDALGALLRFAPPSAWRTPRRVQRARQPSAHERRDRRGPRGRRP